MLKKITSFIVVLFLLLTLFSCSKKAENELTVYAYDSFCSSWGAGNEIVKNFEAETGIKVNLVSCGSGPEMYSRVLLEGSSCKADVVIGLSDTLELDKDIFQPFTPECKTSLIPYDASSNVVPFDYGIIAFNVNEDIQDFENPTCLEDLVKPQFSKSFILIDPRTSSVGLSTLLWTIQTMGEYKAYLWWKQASDNALTVAPSWSMAYGLFTENEAPLVISYTTSPAYHKLNNETFRSKALLFSEGQFRTVEYLGILKTSDRKQNAEKFADFVLTKGQTSIAVSNTMLPANTSTVLPEEFSGSSSCKIINEKSVSLLSTDYYLDKWTEAVSEK